MTQPLGRSLIVTPVIFSLPSVSVIEKLFRNFTAVSSAVVTAAADMVTSPAMGSTWRSSVTVSVTTEGVWDESLSVSCA